MKEKEELYFIASLRMTSKLSETVIPGNHTVIGGLTYQRLNKKPKGKQLKRTLTLPEKDQILYLY